MVYNIVIMNEFDVDRIINMTDLQKLSLIKLKRLGSPLFVMDRRAKRRGGGFVILDIESYRELRRFGAGSKSAKPSRKVRARRLEVDFRSLGLLWDRPEMKNSDFLTCLKDSSHREHGWAMRRLLENAQSSVVTSILTLDELRESMGCLTLRPVFRKAWENAIRYWSESP